MHVFRRWFSVLPSIEIEMKFAATPAVKDRILSKATPVDQKQFTDCYWDREGDFPLTQRDVWLRQRNQNWQLKIPIDFYQSLQKSSPLAHNRIDQYKELETESEICSFLQTTHFIDPAGEASPLHSVLLKNKYSKLFSITTQRASYRFQEATIVIDECLPLGYSIGEIEFMTHDQQSSAKAQQRIRSIAEQLGIDLSAPVYGKVLHYINHCRPQHFQVLKASGLIDSKMISK